MALSPTVVVFEPALLGPLLSLGANVVEQKRIDRDVDIVAMGPDWERLRGLRLGGHHQRALVWLAGGEPPEERALLEPLATIRSLEADEISTALSSLSSGRAPGRIALGPLQVDLAARRVSRDGAEVKLVQREVDILAYLAARPGRDVTREELLTQVWGHAVAVSHKSVDMAIMRLRRKIEPDPAEPRFLLSSYGGGYRLVIPPPPEEAPPSPDPEDLIGRGELIEAISAKIHAGERLVVLVGPAGVGKTRLLSVIARSRAGASPLVSLVSVRTAGEVSVAVASALGIAPGQEPSLGRSLASLGRSLLALDNVEHIEGIGALLARWLEEAPSLQILASSQAPLQGACRVDVPPLDGASAEALFLERARRVGARLPCVGGDPLLGSLVERLGHNPLAIELCAARTRVHPLAELLRHTEDPRLLRDNSQKDPRHRSLLLALDWSLRHLPGEELETLVALSVPRGAVSLPLAGALLGVDTVEAGLMIEPLLDRALCASAEGEVSLLPSVRQAALMAARRDRPDLVAEIEGRHLRWAVDLARTALIEREGPRPRPALDRLARYLPELAAACERAAHRDRDAFGWLSLAREIVYRSYGTPKERQELLDQALSPPPVDRDLEARLLMARGLARAGEPPESSTPELLKAADLWLDLGCVTQAAEALARLGHLWLQKDLPRAISLARRGVEVAPGSPFPRVASLNFEARTSPSGPSPLPAMEEAIEALDLEGRASVACAAATLALDTARMRGDWAAAARIADRLCAIAASVDDPGTVAVAEAASAEPCLDRGDCQEASDRALRALPLLERVGKSDAARRALETLVIAYAHLGRYSEAESAASRLLAMQRASGNTRGVAYTLLKRAVLRLDAGDIDSARATRDEIGALLAGRSEPVIEQSLSLLEGLCLLSEGRLGEIEALLQPLGSSLRPSGRLHVAALRAVTAARLGEEVSLGPFREALAPDWPRIWDWRALATALEGDPAPMRERLQGGPCDGVVRILGRALLDL